MDGSDHSHRAIAAPYRRTAEVVSSSGGAVLRSCSFLLPLLLLLLMLLPLRSAADNRLRPSPHDQSRNPGYRVPGTGFSVYAGT